LKDSSSELSAGLVAKVPLSLSVYFTYNYEWKEVVIEGCVASTHDLAQFGLGGLALEYGAKVDHDQADKPYGINTKLLREVMDIFGVAPAFLVLRIGNAHWFYGANDGLVYHFNDYAKERVGVEMEGNSAKKESSAELCWTFSQKICFDLMRPLIARFSIWSECWSMTVVTQLALNSDGTVLT
jgi:hypothetical protein